MKVALILTILSLQSCAFLGQKSQHKRVERCGILPHCVSTKDDRERFNITPFKISDEKDFKEKIVKYLKSQERVEVKEVTENYIHATYTTKIMKYVDDVEFQIEGNNLHIRSISRIGISDRGLNRKRVNQIFKDLKSLQ